MSTGPPSDLGERDEALGSPGRRPRVDRNERPTSGRELGAAARDPLGLGDRRRQPVRGRDESIETVPSDARGAGGRAGRGPLLRA